MTGTGRSEARTRHNAVSALSLPWMSLPVPSDPPPHCPALLIPFLLLFLMWTSLVTCLLTVRLFSILYTWLEHVTCDPPLLLLFPVYLCFLRTPSWQVVQPSPLATLSAACVLPVVLFCLLHPVFGVRWRDKLCNRFFLSRTLSDACVLLVVLFSLLHPVFAWQVLQPSPLVPYLVRYLRTTDCSLFPSASYFWRTVGWQLVQPSLLVPSLVN